MNFILKILALTVVAVVVVQCDKLAVYWGQDPAGGLHLKVEETIARYCNNFPYDIIPVAFLDIFFARENNDSYPGINIANHCNVTFKGYPFLLHCPKVATSIQTCQKLGKKVLISLGGAAGLYGFTSSSQAVLFASTIWRLFLGGQSDVRPFGNVILDGIDLDIEGGSTIYYADFVRSIRQLMEKDASKSYIITGAPQCPFPDVIMGPGSKGTVLYDIPQEFDYLFVQFYNNYCHLSVLDQFESSLEQWLEFSAETKKKHGKGPVIFVGLPSHPRASSGSGDYQSPEVVQESYMKYKGNESLGGIMLWDASFDLNNVINGAHYSSHLAQFLQDSTSAETTNCLGAPFSIVGKRLLQPWLLTALGLLTILLSLLLITKLLFFTSRRINGVTKKTALVSSGNQEDDVVVFEKDIQKLPLI